MRIFCRLVPLTALTACSDAAQMRAQDLPRLHATEELRLGSEGSRFAFQRILDAARGRDGTIFLVQGNEPSLMMFDSSGESVRRFGQEGQGPGDFQRPGYVGTVGDTVWVSDSGNGALTVIDSTLTLAFIVKPHPDANTLRRARAVQAVGLLEDGSVLATPVFGSMFIAEGIVTARPLLRLTRTGEILDTLATLDIGNGIRTIAHEGGRRAGMTVFVQRLTTDDPLWSMTADGSGVIVVERPVASGSGQAAFRVRKVSPSGTPVFDRRFSYAPVAVPSAVEDSIVDDAARALVDAGIRAGRSSAVDAVREAFFLPDYFPAIRSLVAASDGRIWLEIHPGSAAASRWLVLRPDGRLTATIDLPAGHQVIESHQDELWTVTHDALDVPYVVRHRLSEQRAQ